MKKMYRKLLCKIGCHRYCVVGIGDHLFYDEVEMCKDCRKYRPELDLISRFLNWVEYRIYLWRDR